MKERITIIYEVIEKFHKKTNRGGLLNTSFNLHGTPIVNNVEDALYVFMNTSLNCLLLNSMLLIKDASLITSEKWLSLEDI